MLVGDWRSVEETVHSAPAQLVLGLQDRGTVAGRLLNLRLERGTGGQQRIVGLHAVLRWVQHNTKLNILVSSHERSILNVASWATTPVRGPRRFLTDSTNVSVVPFSWSMVET